MSRKSVRIGIVFVFSLVGPNETKEELEQHIINGKIRETIEQNLPEGWAMQVIAVEVDGEPKKVHYE